MALYFKKEDADELKKLPLIREVIHYLGIPVKKDSILCPLHDDRHYGSCIVSKKRRGVVCYVCNKHISTIKLLKAYNFSYYEALCILAKLSGRDFLYEQTGKSDAIKKEEKIRKRIPERLYNWEEACFLGLAPRIINISTGQSFEVPADSEYYKEMQEDGNILYTTITAYGNPLRELELEDPEAFRYLITQKAKEKMFDAIVTYDCIKEIQTAPGILKKAYPMFKDEKEKLFPALMGCYEEAVRILKKFGEEPPKKKELAAEMFIHHARSCV